MASSRGTIILACVLTIAFHRQVEAQPPPTSLTASSNAANLTNPGYPGYANSADFSWVISAGSGQVIYICFKDFNLEYNYDFLTICDGDNANTSSNCTRHTGNSVAPTRFSSANKVVLRFTSDTSITFTGFSITYKAVAFGTNSAAMTNECNSFWQNRSTPPPPFWQYTTAWMGGNNNTMGWNNSTGWIGNYTTGWNGWNYTTGWNGENYTTGWQNSTPTQIQCTSQYATFNNPGYPGYSNFLTAAYVIRAAQGSVIQICFDDFNIETSYDFVTICEGVISSNCQRFTGFQIPPLRVSSSNVVTLTFTSDSSVTWTGFTCRHKSIPPSSASTATCPAPVTPNWNNTQGPWVWNNTTTWHWNNNTEGPWNTNSTQGPWMWTTTQGPWNPNNTHGPWMWNTTQGPWNPNNTQGPWNWNNTEGPWMWNTTHTQGPWNWNNTEGPWMWNTTQGPWHPNSTQGPWMWNNTEGPWMWTTTQGPWNLNNTQGPMAARFASNESHPIGLIQVYTSTWNYVCGDAWIPPNTVVACRMLGYHNSTFFMVNRQPWDPSTSTSFVCQGWESSLSQCSPNTFSSNCSHIAGVACYS